MRRFLSRVYGTDRRTDSSQHSLMSPCGLVIIGRSPVQAWGRNVECWQLTVTCHAHLFRSDVTDDERKGDCRAPAERRRRRRRRQRRRRGCIDRRRGNAQQTDWRRPVHVVQAPPLSPRQPCLSVNRPRQQSTPKSAAADARAQLLAGRVRFTSRGLRKGLSTARELNWTELQCEQLHVLSALNVPVSLLQPINTKYGRDALTCVTNERVV